MGIQWKRYPSVTCGGKQYFWAYRGESHLWHVVWDRVDEAWLIQFDNQTVKKCKTDKEGKRYVEEMEGVANG